MAKVISIICDFMCLYFRAPVEKRL